MKRLHLHICAAAMTFAALLLSGFSTGAAAREVYNISAGWTFFTSNEPSTDGASIVNLPHIQTSTGTVNYLKSIDVPLTWSGRRVFLRIGGAARVTDIFVDGRHTATHRGGNSAFTVELTDRLRWGVPASVRIVVNSAPGLDVLPTAGGEKTYGGIFRSVELIVCEPLSVSPAASLDPETPYGDDGVWVTTDRLTREKASGRVRLSLLTPPDGLQGATARVRFSDADGNIVAQSSLPITSATPEIPFALSAPHLWQGVADPYLYNVEVTLTSSEGLRTDSLMVSTGFRTVAIDSANNLTLNGQPIKIHGVILRRDRMVVGTALTPFQIEEDIAFILEMGANAVRVAGGQHSDYFYTLCDEAGLLVWSDGPFTGAAYPTDIDFVDTEAFRSNGRRQFGETISQLYNHPSVAMWGVFSNVTARSGNPLTFIKELNAAAKHLDPQRLTASSSVQDGDINFVTDLVSFDLSIGWESGLPDGVVPWLAQLRRGWPNLRSGISYSAGASILHQSEQLERPLPTSSFHPEGWQTFFHEEYMRNAVDAPGLWGVFVGTMFDSGAAKVASGAVTGSPTGFVAGSGGGIDDRGLVTFDRKDRKDAFWLYKANWNRSEPFVRIGGSRLDGRTERRQTIRVYSNLSEVELFMGGHSLGRRTGERGVFVWENVGLRTGVNRFEARGTGAIADSAVSDGSASSAITAGTATQAGSAGSPVVTDRASISIYPAAATSSQPATSTTTTTTPVSAASAGFVPETENLTPR